MDDERAKRLIPHSGKNLAAFLFGFLIFSPLTVQKIKRIVNGLEVSGEKRKVWAFFPFSKDKNSSMYQWRNSYEKHE